MEDFTLFRPLDDVIEAFKTAKCRMWCIAILGILSSVYALTTMTMMLFMHGMQNSFLFVVLHCLSLLVTFVLVVFFIKASLAYAMLHRHLSWQISNFGRMSYECFLVELDLVGVSMHISRQTYDEYVREWNSHAA